MIDAVAFLDDGYWLAKANELAGIVVGREDEI